MEEVKFLKGKFEDLPKDSMDANAIYVADDKAVIGASGNLYYGQPSIGVKDDNIVLYGVKDEEETSSVEISQVPLNDITKTLELFYKFEDVDYGDGPIEKTRFLNTFKLSDYSSFTIFGMKCDYRVLSELKKVVIRSLDYGGKLPYIKDLKTNVTSKWYIEYNIQDDGETCVYHNQYNPVGGVKKWLRNVFNENATPLNVEKWTRNKPRDSKQLTVGFTTWQRPTIGFGNVALVTEGESRAKYDLTWKDGEDGRPLPPLLQIGGYIHLTDTIGKKVYCKFFRNPFVNGEYTITHLYIRFRKGNNVKYHDRRVTENGFIKIDKDDIKLLEEGSYVINNLYLGKLPTYGGEDYNWYDNKEVKFYVGGIGLEGCIVHNKLKRVFPTAESLAIKRLSPNEMCSVTRDNLKCGIDPTKSYYETSLRKNPSAREVFERALHDGFTVNDLIDYTLEERNLWVWRKSAYKKRHKWCSFFYNRRNYVKNGSWLMEGDTMVQCESTESANYKIMVDKGLDVHRIMVDKLASMIVGNFEFDGLEKNTEHLLYEVRYNTADKRYGIHLKQFRYHFDAKRFFGGRWTSQCKYMDLMYAPYGSREGIRLRVNLAHPLINFFAQWKLDETFATQEEAESYISDNTTYLDLYVKEEFSYFFGELRVRAIGIEHHPTKL